MIKRLREKLRKRWKDLLRQKRVPSAFKDNHR